MSGQNDAPIIIETGTQPVAACIWLHGLGADGHDFVPVVEQLNLIAPMRFVLPHAPVRPVTLNGGMPMRAWFDIASLQLDAQVDEIGIVESSAHAQQLAAQQGLPVCYAGFSQGGVVALHAGLHGREAPLGVMALSTWYSLPVPPNQLEVFMAHGEYDEIVPVQLAEHTARKLQHQGAHVQWQVYPMGHHVSPEEVGALNSWLNQRLEHLI